MINPIAVIEEFLDSHDLEFSHDLGERQEARFFITLPGEKKLQTLTALIVGERSVTISAFIIRKPEENSAKVHEWLLQKNSEIAPQSGISFAVNHLGDIFLVGRVPIQNLTEIEIDRILGAILQISDASFNTLIELGFGDSVRREAAWRIDRGESIEHLNAFDWVKIEP